jgi:hypothetical protein
MGAGETGQAVAEFAGSLGGAAVGATRIPQGPPRQPKAPTVDELRTQKNAAYDTVEAAGVRYRPEAVSGLNQSARARMEAGGFDPDLHRPLVSALKKLDSVDGQPLTLPKLDQVRQFVRDEVFTPTASKGQRRLGHMLIDEIDGFIAKAGPADVLSNGDPSEAATTLLRARNLNTRIAKVETIEGAAERAKRRASGSGSGGNIDNTTRQEMRKVLERGRAWSPDERAALDKIANGGRGQNALRAAGKMAPTGNGLQQTLHLGAALQSNGATLPLSVAGAITKHIADNITQRRVAKLVQLMARGGKPAVDAEAQLALMASRNAQIAKVYREMAEQVLRTGVLAGAGAMSATAAQGQEPQ